MTEIEIIALVREGTPPFDAADLADLYDLPVLAERLRAAGRERSPDAAVRNSDTVWSKLDRCKFSALDLAKAAGLPASTVQAAVKGRVAASMTDKEAAALLAYLQPRAELILEVCLRLKRPKAASPWGHTIGPFA